MENIEFFNIEQLKTEPSAKLTWSKVPECSYYIISRKILNEDNSDFVQIAKTKKEIYYDRKLEYNKNYSYKLRAVFDLDFFELNYDTNNIILSDYKTHNFYNEGIKYSDMESEFPFNQMELVDENKNKVEEYSKAKFLKIPKFYYFINEETKKISVSKSMINYDYDLFYSFIIDNEIKDEIYISLNSFEENIELKENQFKMDISCLNLIQFLYFIYFGTLDKKALIVDNMKFNSILNKPFNSDGIDNFLFGIKNLFSEELFIDGILNKNNKILMSINPLENNNEGFGYEEYDDFILKNGLITEYDLDYFMPLKVLKNKNETLKLNGKYLNLNNNIFNYDFKDEKSKKYRICEFK